MKTQGVVDADPRERRMHRATGSEIVFAVHLEPRHRRPFGEDALYVRCAQTDPGGCRDRMLHLAPQRSHCDVQPLLPGVVEPPAIFSHRPAGMATKAFGSRAVAS